MTSPRPLTYETSGRSPRAVAVLVLVYAALLAGYLFLNAAPGIIGILAAFTLPALWELVIGHRAGLQLDRTQLSWFSGRREDKVDLMRIDRVRFDTRIDLSQRVTIYLTDGTRKRLPSDSVPPPKRLRAALEARDVKVEQHHFLSIG